MQVIYLGNFDFAITGTGNIGYNSVRSIYKHKYLKKVIVREYRKTEIDDSLIFKPIPFGRFIPRLLNGFYFYLIHNINKSFYLNDILFDRFSLKYIDKCDIFHSWSTPISCTIKAKNLGALIITDGASSHPMTSYNLLAEEYKRYNVKSPLYKRLRDMTIKQINLSDYIFVPSDFVYDSYIENGVPKEKLIKIPFGVDLDKFKPIRRKKDKFFRAIFVGQIELRKGVQYLLEAWHKLDLKDSELILRGRIHPDAKKIVDSYRDKINLKTPGFGDPKEDYSNSDIFVFPSIEEGSALVSYEAMASGLPIIVTFNTGSVAREGIDGFIVPIRDTNILADKIKFFYDNPKQIIKMGSNARKNIENYSWKNYGENIVKAYKMVLNERKK